MKSLIILVLSAFMLAGCVENVQVAQNSAPVARKSSLFTKADEIELHGESSIKGERRVAVPLFRVAFYTEKDAGETAKGTGSTGTATTSVDSNLLGIDQAVFQKVTDVAYQDFIAKLKAAGFEIIPYAEIARAQSFQGLDVVSSPHTEKALFGQDALYVAPNGTKLALPGSVTGLSGAFSGGAAEKIVPKLVKEMQAAMIDVTYYVDYLNTTTEGGGWFSTRATVEIGQGIYVMPGSGAGFQGYAASKCTGYCPDMWSSAKLGQVIYSNEPVGELRDVTSDAAKTTEKVMNVIGGLLTGSVRQHREYELQGDPAKYQKVATEVLGTANQAIVSSLAAHL